MRLCGRRAAIATALLAVLPACSIANFGPLAGADERDRTGSVTPMFGAPAAIGNADLAVVRGATAALFESPGRASAPWESPLTGARGTITRIAAAYRDGIVECHDFLASYLRGRDEAWLEGEACRNAAGRWQVRSLKPLHRQP